MREEHDFAFAKARAARRLQDRRTFCFPLARVPPDNNVDTNDTPI